MEPAAEDRPAKSLPSLESKKKLSKKNDISTFINKTFNILEDKEISDIISWTDNGNSFIVKNKEKFESMVLPRYFKHRKFSSFVRQLNMYDFHKLRKEKQIPIFRHKYFKMNKRELLSKIKRKCVEENGENQAAEDEEMIDMADDVDPSQVEIHDQLESLARQNQQLYKEVQYLQGQYLHNQEIKNKQKQKWTKMVHCLLYSDLDKEVRMPGNLTLQSLVEHLLDNQEESLKVEEYRTRIAAVYTLAKDRLCRKF